MTALESALRRSQRLSRPGLGALRFVLFFLTFSGIEFVVGPLLGDHPMGSVSNALRTGLLSAFYAVGMDVLGQWWGFDASASSDPGTPPSEESRRH